MSWLPCARVDQPHVGTNQTPQSGIIAMLTFILWLLLFIFCWPLALLALLLYPLIWLVLLPFRLLGFAVEGVFEFLRALLLMPARLLRGRPVP